MNYKCLFFCYLYLLGIVVSMFWLYIWVTSSSPVFGFICNRHPKVILRLCNLKYVLIWNKQSRETGNIEYTRRSKTKQKHKTICVGHNCIVVSMFWLYIWVTSSSPVFGGVRVSHLFSFLHCLIMYFYVLSFVLWCPLQCPHSNDVWFVLTASCL
jgi:hypothetical protein